MGVHSINVYASGGRLPVRQEAPHFLASARAIIFSSLSWSAAGRQAGQAAAGQVGMGSSTEAMPCRRHCNRGILPASKPASHLQSWRCPPSASPQPSCSQACRTAPQNGLFVTWRRGRSHGAPPSQRLRPSPPVFPTTNHDHNHNHEPRTAAKHRPPTCHPRASCQRPPSLCSPAGSGARCTPPAAAAQAAAHAGSRRGGQSQGRGSYGSAAGCTHPAPAQMQRQAGSGNMHGQHRGSGSLPGQHPTQA